MKKLLYVAVMALTMGFFASCNGGPGTSMQYDEGQNPSINVEDGTVNGKSYDNETEKCWEMTMSVKVPYAGTATTKAYEWGTEFFIVSVGEASVAQWNHEGCPAGYSYKAVSAEDYDACHDLNPDDYDD